MATKAKKSKPKKSTQTYTCVDLYEGDALNSGYGTLSLTRQETTPVRISILQGQYSSTFIVNRRREGTSKNGIPWKKWEVWGQVIMSTRALNKAGIKKLNLYGKYRMREGGPSTWFPFRNITSHPHLFSQIVAEKYRMAVNNEIARLVAENIGTSTPDFADYEWATDQTHPGLNYRERIALNKGKTNPSMYAMHVAYPVTKTMHNDIDSLPSGMTQHLRHDNMMEVVRSMYGSKLYRKDLVKAVSEAPLPLSANALLLKGIVPIDWIINLLGDHHGVLANTIGPVQAKTLKALFRSLTPAQQKRFIAGLTRANPKEKVSGWAFADTMRMLKTLNERYNVNFAPGQIAAKTWRELHDNLAKDLSRRGVQDQPIEKVKLAEKIDKVALPDGYSLILPKSTHELIDWGRDMGHCIGSYIHEAVQGESVFLGIIKDKKMIGNAQISVKQNRLVQIFGKRNAYLDKNTLEVFSDGMIKNKVLTKTGFQHAYGYQLGA